MMTCVYKLGTVHVYCNQAAGAYPNMVWRPLKGQLANSADPDHMLQNVASDQGLHCLQIV